MADLYVHPHEQAKLAYRKIAVNDLAKDKAIPQDFLHELGLQNTADGIVIPYRLMDGSEAPRQRLRTALQANKGSYWLPKKSLEATVPYGLDRLGEARKQGYIVLVEGESDCWAMWLNGFPAMGIPGAGMTKTLRREQLEGITTLYVYQEPDSGGTAFVQGIARQLQTLGWKNEVFVLSIEGVKDPNELHKNDPNQFKEKFQAALESAKSKPLLLEQDREQKSFVDGLLQSVTFDLNSPIADLNTEKVVVENLLCADDLALWVGHEKQRKSTLLLQFCSCLASGRSFLGFRIPQPVRVLYFDAESKRHDLAKRWAGIQQILPESEQQRVRENLKLIEGRKLLAHGLSLDIKAQTLEEIIKKNETAQLIVLDPLRIFYTGDEDKSSQVCEAMTQLRRIAHGRALIIVHHARKRNNSPNQLHLDDDPYAWSDNTRGSNAWKAHADSIILQELRNDDELGEILHFAVIHRSFANISPLPLVTSETTFAWHERLADQAPELARKRLSKKDAELYQIVFDHLDLKRVASKSDVVRLLTDAGIAKATAYRKIDHFDSLGFLDMDDSTGAVTLALPSDEACKRGENEKSSWIKLN